MKALERIHPYLRVLTRAVVLVALVFVGDLVCRMRMRWSTIPVRTALDSLQQLSGRLLRALGLRVDRRGEPPRQQVLVVANHRSYVDIPLVLSEVPAVFLAKHEIGQWPLFGRLAKLAETVFVVREDAESRKQALVELASRLDDGLPIIVFPEGTTSHGPGLASFRAGAFRLAAERGIPVVPVALSYGHRNDAWVGDDDFLRHFFERFALPEMRVSISFGSPIYGSDGVTLALRAEQWIRNELRPLDAPVFADAAEVEHDAAEPMIADVA